MRRVAFHTLGCRLNQAETAAMAGRFHALGFDHAPDDGKADVVVLHSCAVTGPAEQESLRLLRRLRRQSPQALIVFAGCATKVIAEATLRTQGADLVVGQEAKASLPRLAAAALGLSPAGEAPSALPRFATARAWIKVQDGCDFRCAYCIVPDTRGAPRSRPQAEVIHEAAALARQGFRELVLTGVNLGCYADGPRKLPDLVRALARLPVPFRIRLSSIEPGTVEREIAEFAAGEPRLCRMLHLPLQSGDPGILRAMRRRYTAAQYETAVEAALQRLPFLGLGADVIVGFPGEDEAAFETTRRLLERLPFSNLHVFPYSERPGTPAAALHGKVPGPLRRERVRMLRALAVRKRRAFAARFVGRTVEVLVERVDAAGTGTGWTGEYLEARVPGLTPAAVGTLQRFTPTGATEAVLVAEAAAV